MKKNFKRIGALVFALIMTMGVTATVFADPADLTNGKAGELYTSENEGAKVDNTVSIDKQIVIFNTTDNTDVHNPNIAYNYTINGAGGDFLITDGDGDQGKIYTGITTALDSATKSVTFSSADTTEAGTKGAVAEKSFEVTFNPDAFTHAGIFRYVISEADNSTGRTAAGIARKGTDVDRILDVYVRVDSNDDDGDTSKTDFVIYGYVLMTANSSVKASNLEDGDESMKTNGFLPDYNAETGVVTKGDYYNTYNLQVKKAVKGTLADKNEDFPFGIALSNAAITAQPVVELAGQATGLAAFAVDGTLSVGNGASDSTLKLKDTEFVTITGIPAEITSTVTEYNSSYDIYKPNITDTAVTGGTATYTSANVQPGGTAVISAVTGTNTSTTNALIAGDLVLTVTNEIEIVSPTGIVMRFAPYVLIVAAGIILFAVSRRRRAA